jgi:hypothetical protein
MANRDSSLGILFAALLLVTASCRAPSRSELVGSYKIRYSYGSEELRLYDNGTYVQIVSLDRGGLRASNSGKWEYREKEGELALNAPLLVDDNFGKVSSSWMSPKAGLWSLAAEKWPTGSVTLFYSPDFDYRFKKIK